MGKRGSGNFSWCNYCRSKKYSDSPEGIDARLNSVSAKWRNKVSDGKGGFRNLRKGEIRPTKGVTSALGKVSRKIKETVEVEISDDIIEAILNELYETPLSFQEQVAEILASTHTTLSEDVDAIFNGENLSEEFKTKATTIFEAAVTSRVQTIAEQLETIAVTQLDEAVEQVKDELTNQVDDYLNYMVEEWVSENEIAIEKGLRSEIVEDFISGLRTLFVEHYIDVPEDKVDLVAELSEKVEELQDSLNTEIARGMEFKKQLGEAKKSEILDAVCEGLVQTQVEKVKTLAESVSFTTDQEYAEKLKTIRENYFPTKIKSNTNRDILNENQLVTDETTGNEITDPLMKSLVGAISRTVK